MRHRRLRWLAVVSALTLLLAVDPGARLDLPLDSDTAFAKGGDGGGKGGDGWYGLHNGLGWAYLKLGRKAEALS